ncbi:Aste57867_697 [Aphanomyces stellatus]|uniref:Aste57867_697 protein n=1 Tax=Aphanomyces stellatus TaxID=120398 RepID=A0A485K6I6_9STRA|nr:hypothetical protein As57867_000696 [Aphanomyces stellatus]VFT77921.1 Aste57867_697 [Aphanomyces stellatus]
MLGQDQLNETELRGAGESDHHVVPSAPAANGTPFMRDTSPNVSLAALVHQTEELLSTNMTSAASEAPHPDFHKLTAVNPSTASEENENNLREAKTWLQYCPVHANQWVIYEVKLRPDILMVAIEDLLSTVLLCRGLKPDGATLPTGCDFYRRKLTDPPQTTMFHVPKDEIVFTRVGVSGSKLRVLRLFVAFASPVPQVMSSSNTQLHAAADAIFHQVRSAIMDVGYALTILSSPAFCDETCDDNVTLDEDYIRDVKSVFDSEMKANLRQLSLPLEEYAHGHELACAQLMSLLEPVYVQFKIVKPQPKRIALERTPDQPYADEPTDALPPSRGARVTHLVHALWKKLDRHASATVAQKIHDKKKQVEGRVEFARELRHAAITCIVEHEPTKEMLKTALGPSCVWDGALLYDGSCILGKIPAKLYVTYERMIFKYGMLMFATMKEIPFDNIAGVTKPTVMGIAVLSIRTKEPAEDVQITVASDIDRIFQLLEQIFIMHAQPLQEVEDVFVR